MIAKTFGNFFKQKRISLGLTLREFCRINELDPGNISVYLALGTIYQNMGKSKEAEELYNKVIAKEPDNYNANNLIGVSYYNQGADIYNQSTELKDQKQADKMEAKAKEVWKQSIPFLEKAHKVNPADKETKNLLMSIYLKIGEQKKFQGLKEEK